MQIPHFDDINMALSLWILRLLLPVLLFEFHYTFQLFFFFEKRKQTKKQRKLQRKCNKKNKNGPKEILLRAEGAI